MMNAFEYLTMLVDDIHSTVVATVDSDDKPHTCVIDMMLADENGLYFLTAKGKAFYQRLIAAPNVSITGFAGEDTMHAHSITVQGKVREIGDRRLGEIFEKNPYMTQIYPSVESQKALTVFQIYAGKGEFFDLSHQPIFREQFAFGGELMKEIGYVIGEDCIGCKRCFSVCPQKCINISTVPAVIKQSHCLHCGRCAEICPKQTIRKRG